MTIKEAEAFDLGFPFCVEGDRGDRVWRGGDECEEWCLEQFGELAWDSTHVADAMVAVYVGARWSYRHGAEFIYLFRDEADAMLFKLRWVG